MTMLQSLTARIQAKSDSCGQLRAMPTMIRRSVQQDRTRRENTLIRPSGTFSRKREKGKLLQALLLVFGLLLASAGEARAAERITSFTSEVAIGADSALTVKETIALVSEG